MASARDEQQVAIDKELKAHAKELERLQAIVHLQEVKIKLQNAAKENSMAAAVPTATTRLQMIVQHAKIANTPAKLHQAISMLQEKLRVSQEKVTRLEQRNIKECCYWGAF